MRCLWCNDSFSSWLATRMISHVLKRPKGGLGVCTGIIPKARYEWYQEFHDQKGEKKEKKRGTDKLITSMTDQQDAAAAMLTNSCKKQERPIHIDLSVSSGWGGLKMASDVGIEKRKTMDIRKSNSALLEMTIADIFHCKHLPDRAVESKCFRKILDVVKVVGSGLTIPSKKNIGGELLFSIETISKMFLQKYFIHIQVNC